MLWVAIMRQLRLLKVPQLLLMQAMNALYILWARKMQSGLSLQSIHTMKNRQKSSMLLRSSKLVSLRSWQSEGRKILQQLRVLIWLRIKKQMLSFQQEAQELYWQEVRLLQVAFQELRDLLQELLFQLIIAVYLLLTAELMLMQDLIFQYSGLRWALYIWRIVQV